MEQGLGFVASSEGYVLIQEKNNVNCRDIILIGAYLFKDYDAVNTSHKITMYWSLYMID